MTGGDVPARAPSEAEVIGYLKTLSNWGRWGTDDELGTLNLITPAKRIAAVRPAATTGAGACYFTGTVKGWPFSVMKNTTDLYGSVVLGFLASCTWLGG